MDERLVRNILLTKPKFLSQKKYWINKLAGPISRTRIIPDVNNLKTNRVMRELYYNLPNEISKEIIQMSKDNNLSLYIIALAALKTMIYRYTGESCSVIGSPVYMMNYNDETLNSKVALLDYLSEDSTFKDIIIQVKDTCIQAYKNQDYPFDDIVDIIDIHASEDMEPIFDIVCMLDNIHEKDHVKDFNGDMMFFFSRDGGKLDLTIKYNSELFTESMIERFYMNYISLLQIVLKNVDLKISEIKYISEKEQLLLNNFNNTDSRYETRYLIHQLFEEIVSLKPQQTALVYEDTKLSYKELNDRSNRLASFLRKKGVCSGSIVGVMMEKSHELIVSLMAILKAGGAYLPIDVECPHQRILQILEDAEVKILISSKNINDIQENIIDDGIDILIPSSMGKLIEGESRHNIEYVNKPNDLAYILYTSGSTGKPKGVMIEHRNVVNLLKWFRNKYDLEKNNRILQLTNVTFDVSVEEIFGSLISGATVYIPSRETMMSREKLREYIEENEINIAQFVPVTLREFLGDAPKMNSLRKVICGGDRLDLHLKNQIIELGYELYNHYGPTEITVDAIVEKCNEDIVTLGKPIANTKIYIVDKYEHLCPIGAAGEICIAGEGVARGYLGNDELTDERFVANPFVPETTMYKTGDIGRWLESGDVEFLGRLDNQVKIRGFRIEIGEIEYWLKSYNGVKDGLVDVKSDKNGNKILCAYIVENENVDLSDIRTYLLKVLPEYMVPLHIIKLQSLPLNQNGKVDLKSLPDPEFTKRNLKLNDMPRNEVEEKIVEVWCEVLGLEKVGINDNFFHIGGDSIKAIQIVSRLQKRSLSIDIKDIFTYPQICDLSSFVKVVGSYKIEEKVSGEVLLTPIQKWFFQQDFTEMNHWNQSFMLYNKNRFDQNNLKKAINKLLEHHDALRMAFELTDEGVYQSNLDYNNETNYFKIIDLMNEYDYKNKLLIEAEAIQKDIDLEKGKMLVSGLFKTPEGDYLLLAIHHLIVDGVSWRIILEDFTIAYNQLCNGDEIELQDKSTSFKTWANKVYKYASSKRLLDEVSYWKEIEESNILPLPKEFIASSNKVRDGNTLSIVVSEVDTQKILNQVNKIYNTEINDILLTALGLAVKKWIGFEKIAINLEGHGREYIDENIDISRTVGWFTTVFPVVLDVKHSDDLSYLIRSVKEGLRKIPNKGFGYGILRYITPSDIKKDIEFKLRPGISFNYLGQFGSELNNGIYNFTELSSDTAVSRNSERVCSIDINGMVMNGKLTFTFNYNTKEYSEMSILRFMEYFKQNLELIIKHCTENKAKKLTPTDLGYGKLSLQGLDKINRMLNAK